MPHAISSLLTGGENGDGGTRERVSKNPSNHDRRRVGGVREEVAPTVNQQLQLRDPTPEFI